MFHVKHLQTEEAAGNSFTDISEVQQVGSEGANTIASVATGCSHTGMTEHEHVGSEGAKHANRGTAGCRTMAKP